MAHNLKEYDKQQGVQVAWHKKTEVKELITLDDNYLRTFDIKPVRLQKNGQDSKWTILECTDAPELEIGQPYNPETFKPITNADFLELVRKCIGGTDHKIVSVGSVRNRGRIFLSVELVGMEKFKAAGRQFSAFLNFGNGHDKSSVLWVNTSNTCTVCDNTFTFNLVSVENKAESTGESGDISMKQRHTKNVVLKLPAMADLVDKAIGVQGEFQIEFDKLGQVSIVKDDAKSLFAGFVGRKITKADVKKGLSTRAVNTVDRLVQLYDKGAGNSGETMADAFSAVTDYYSHFSSGGENVFRQVVSSEYGAGLVAKTEFWNMLGDSERFTATQERGVELLANTK